MERECPICGEVVTDDSLEYCPLCGNMLPPPEGMDEEGSEEVYVASIDEDLDLESIEEELDSLEVSYEDENSEDEKNDYEAGVFPGDGEEEIIEEGAEESSITDSLNEEESSPEMEDNYEPYEPDKTDEIEPYPDEGGKEPDESHEEAQTEEGVNPDISAVEAAAVAEAPVSAASGAATKQKKPNKRKKSKKKSRKDTGDGKKGRKPDSEERLEKKKKIREEAKKKESGPTIFNYYVLNTVTLLFFTILAVFTLVEFILLIFNITAEAPDVLFKLSPFLGSIMGMQEAPVLFVVVILLSVDAALHHWDKKKNLQISLIITVLMMIGLIFGVVTYQSTIDAILALMILLIFGLVFFLDWVSIQRYPKILEDPGRENLEEFLMKEEEIATILEEEEEKLSLKEQEIEELQQRIDLMGNQLAEEEEKLRMKEEEIAQIQAEIQMKEQELLAEEEEIAMKENELQTVIESELKQRMAEQMMEEEERLRMKEEELIRAKNELEIQRKLHEEAREKLRMKEQELNTLRSELEKQIRERLEEEEKLKMKEAATRMKEQDKQKRVLFPFTAMVGQEDMKKTLILNAIYPEIGGVLIKGNKGTGKSVSVRGLAEVLPDIEVTGCRFNCDPNDVENLCPECRAKYEKGELESFKRPVKVVDLPLNITEDRLLGSIDIEKILKEGTRSFEPGLLAEAHRGILYVDEINLLDDYIVDLLLDAASSGRVVIEREGISFTYPSKFIIVGSMNPEEGELRPQLLDRLALQVDVVGIKNVEDRMEIVRRRKEFTENPELFREKWSGEQAELKRKIMDARERLNSITTPPHILDIIGKLCVEFDVDGHRADIIVERAARANAAYEGRKEVTMEDLIVAATYALPHRARKVEAEFSRELIESAIKRLEKGGS